MKLALIGFGAMGQMVAHRAKSAGCEVVATVRRGDRPDDRALTDRLASADAVIDFSSAQSVMANARLCCSASKPLVIGTTGWNDSLGELKAIVENVGGAVVHGANFSVGVNVFYRVAAIASKMLAAAGGYEPFIEEQHHARKKDAPSGTALKLKSIVAAATRGEVSVASTRAGHITGTHRVGFDSGVDQILLTHTARSREGFADGAILAAKWIVGRRGVYEFGEVMDAMLKETEVTR